MIKDFRLDSLLERDAVGESFRATHIVLDRQFIIKIIDQKFINNAGENACRQLGYEAQAAVELRHPNIARVYEFGTIESGGFYTATEFSGGRSLRDSLRNQGSLSETDAVTIAEQAAEALIAAHEAGFIHRAVSPANIFLSRDGDDKISVKLGNFDLGGIREKTVAADENQGASVEMLRYQSPEQCDGQTSDEKTDVYSLGIVLYEMLCGRSPFAAPTLAVISERKINQEPLSKLRFETKALFANTIKDALQKKPAARLQLANFAQQLRHIAQVLYQSGDSPSERSRLPLSPALAVDQAEFDGADVFTSAPNLESAELINGDRTPIETSVPLKIETAPVITANPNDQIAEVNSFGSKPILVRKKRVDEDSSAFAPPVSSADQTAEADLFASEPILIRKKRVDEDLFKTGGLQNEHSLETGNPQFDQNATADEHSFDAPIPVFVGKKHSFENSIDDDDSEQITVIGKKSNAVPVAPVMFDAPHENVVITRQTKTAAPDFTNYSGENRPPYRVVPTNRSALAGIGLLGLLLASLVLAAFLYNRNQPEQAVISETTPVAEPPASSVPENLPQISANKVETVENGQNAAPETTTSAPTISERTSVATPDKRAEPAKPIAPIREQAASLEPATEADGKPRTELNNALNELTSATNSGDVEQQMSYYAPKLDSYYLSRNASQNAVRAEKSRVFSRADEVAIQTGKPDIKLSPDGRRATMRFRKKYAIKQGEKNRSGEVVQELQWVKSGNDWRIVSERDVKVINR